MDDTELYFSFKAWCILDYVTETKNLGIQTFPAL